MKIVGGSFTAGCTLTLEHGVHGFVLATDRRIFCVGILLFFCVTVLGTSGRAHASEHEAEHEACRMNQSRCSEGCVKDASKPSGKCCKPTTCAAQGKNCGTIPNGTCSQSLNCGSCTFPATCGGGGTANVCGCAPTTCAAQGNNCGTISDGCGGTLSCGSCDAPDTCGGGGTPNVCGCQRLTCADVAATCGTISDGCGGTLDCTSYCQDDAHCKATERCISGFNRQTGTRGTNTCEPKAIDGRGCNVHKDCLSDCCCALTQGGVQGGFGLCTDFAGCSLAVGLPSSPWTLSQCPGETCQTDGDCNATTQFCTGGSCKMKQDLGSACVFSSACGGGDDFHDVEAPACCCMIGAGAGTCSTQDHCIRVSGGTCECSAPSQFGGVCPGSPCGQDSDCAPDYEFCTAGVCKPKQVKGSACAFSSACLGPPALPAQGCCCDKGGASAVCEQFHVGCESDGGSCLP